MLCLRVIVQEVWRMQIIRSMLMYYIAYRVTAEIDTMRLIPGKNVKEF